MGWVQQTVSAQRRPQALTGNVPANQGATEVPIAPCSCTQGIGPGLGTSAAVSCSQGLCIMRCRLHALPTAKVASSGGGSCRAHGCSMPPALSVPHRPGISHPLSYGLRPTLSPPAVICFKSAPLKVPWSLISISYFLPVLQQGHARH